MTGEDDAVPEVRARPWAALVAVLGVGLAVGGVAGALLVVLRDGGGDERSVEPLPTTVPVDLDGALLGAGVPESLLDCAAATIADRGSAGVADAAADPLEPGSAGREAIEACAREHLAAEVRTGAGIDHTDAFCVAGELLDRVGLELVLASIDALAVTAEVQQAATDAANACASRG